MVDERIIDPGPPVTGPHLKIKIVGMRWSWGKSYGDTSNMRFSASRACSASSFGTVI